MGSRKGSPPFGFGYRLKGVRNAAFRPVGGNAARGGGGGGGKFQTFSPHIYDRLFIA